MPKLTDKICSDLPPYLSYGASFESVLTSDFFPIILIEYVVVMLRAKKLD